MRDIHLKHYVEAGRYDTKNDRRYLAVIIHTFSTSSIDIVVNVGQWMTSKSEINGVRVKCLAGDSSK